MKISKGKEKEKIVVKYFWSIKLLKVLWNRGYWFRGIFVQWLGELNNLARDTRKPPGNTSIHKTTLSHFMDCGELLYSLICEF